MQIKVGDYVKLRNNPVLFRVCAASNDGHFTIVPTCSPEGFKSTWPQQELTVVPPPIYLPGDIVSCIQHIGQWRFKIYEVNITKSGRYAYFFTRPGTSIKDYGFEDEIYLSCKSMI